MPIQLDAVTVSGNPMKACSTVDFGMLGEADGGGAFIFLVLTLHDLHKTYNDTLMSTSRKIQCVSKQRDDIILERI